MSSDRLFGLVVLMTALAYMASATQIQTSFLADPVGPKAFPLLVGAIAAISALVMIIKPDPDPQWPAMRTFVSLAVAVIILVAYAKLLRPLGFLLPTAFAAGALSYQISPRPLPAIFTGLSLSIGLFVLFKYALKLGLVPFPKGVFS